MIVLDTHVWLWWMSVPEKLSKPARAAIDAAIGIGISTLSAWEVAMLAARGRIGLDRDVALWIRQALAEPRVEPLPPSAEIAVTAALLDSGEFPGDPVDRMIYATAQANSAVLVTRDAAMRAFNPASTVW